MAGGFAVTINVRCEKGNVASRREMFIFQFNSNNKLCYCSSVSSAVPRACAMAVIVPGFLQQKMPSQRGAGANSTGPSMLHGPAGVGDEAALLLLPLLQSQLPPPRLGVFEGFVVEARAQPGPETWETDTEGVCVPYSQLRTRWQRTSSLCKGEKQLRGSR